MLGDEYWCEECHEIKMKKKIIKLKKKQGIKKK